MLSASAARWLISAGVSKRSCSIFPKNCARGFTSRRLLRLSGRIGAEDVGAEFVAEFQRPPLRNWPVGHLVHGLPGNSEILSERGLIAIVRRNSFLFRDRVRLHGRSQPRVTA